MCDWDNMKLATTVCGVVKLLVLRNNFFPIQ